MPPIDPTHDSADGPIPFGTSDPGQVSSYDPDRFARLEDYEDRVFWFGVRNRIIQAALLPVLNMLEPGYRVLEAGCGTGNVLRMLEATCTTGTVIGIEQHGAGVSVARRRVSCPVYEADVHDVQFDEPFDVIGLFDVIEHLDDDAAVLNKLKGDLRAGPTSRIILTVPAHPTLWSAFDVAAHHRRRYTPASLRRALETAGLDVGYLTYFMGALYPVMKLRRKAAASRGVCPEDTMAETNLSTNRLANRVATLLTTPEISLVRRRARLPLGTSLLAIAQLPDP